MVGKDSYSREIEVASVPAVDSDYLQPGLPDNPGESPCGCGMVG